MFQAALEAKVRVSKGNTLYVPKAIARIVGIEERSLAMLRVEKALLVLKKLYAEKLYA